LVGATFLIGICVGCLFVTKLADIYGRKPVYLLGLILNFVIIAVLMLVNSVIPIFVCLFFLGISITCRYYVGYSYSLEFQPAS
jgi:MFS family permease